MKITRKQLTSITNILEDETSVQRKLHNEMYSNRRKSILNEAEIYDSMHSDDLSGVVSSALEQDVVEAGQNLRVEFDKKLFKELARLVAQAGGEKVSGPTLQDDLEDFDADGLMELQMELSTDISAALEKYMSQIAMFVTHVKLSGTE